MIVSKIWISAPLLAAAALLSACDKEKSETAEPHGEEMGTEVSGATFKEGRGLKFMPESAAAIGLKTASVEERPVSRTVTLMAQVLEAGPPAILSASVADSDTDWYRTTPFREVSVTRIDRSMSAATGMADLSLSWNHAGLPAGEWVRLTLIPKDAPAVVAVPKSAVLRSAGGVFVYAVSGEYWVRTPVKTGAESDGFVEITDGLYSGDTIVTSPVEQLWLIELRAVKGGAGCGS